MLLELSAREHAVLDAFEARHANADMRCQQLTALTKRVSFVAQGDEYTKQTVQVDTEARWRCRDSSSSLRSDPCRVRASPLSP